MYNFLGRMLLSSKIFLVCCGGKKKPKTKPSLEKSLGARDGIRRVNVSGVLKSGGFYCWTIATTGKANLTHYCFKRRLLREIDVEVDLQTATL